MSALLDYMRLCRLCLVKDKVNVPIFGSTSDVRQIFLKISACLPVKVSQDDNLPKSICDSCQYKIDLLYQFWNTTVNAEKQLIQWITEIGVDVNIKDTNPPSLQSHAHPHSMSETMILKQERPDPDIKNMEQIETKQDSMYSAYQPQIKMTVGAPTDFTQPCDAEEDIKLSDRRQTQFIQPSPAKRRGRPPKQATTASSENIVTPAATTSTATSAVTNSKRRSSAAAAAAAVAAAVASMSSDESDMDDRLGGDDSDDEDMDVPITKEEADSDDEEYVDNPEALEPTTFVGIPSGSADSDQPGPSGLGGGSTTGKMSSSPVNNTANESGFNIKLPPGIRVKHNGDTNANEEYKKKSQEPGISKSLQPKQESIYKEFLNKFGYLSTLNIKKVENNTGQEEKKDTTGIVENLIRSGLIVKKVPDTTKKSLVVTDVEKKVFVLKEKLVNSDDSEDLEDESEYEIETLDDDESDLEYVPELKKMREGKRAKENLQKSPQPRTSPKKKSGEFMQIISTNYMCVMCQQKFPSLELLTSHMRSPTPCRVLVVQCEVCGKEFPNKSRCSAHMYTHKEKQKYSCDKCKKQFSTQVSLQVHSEFNHTDHFDSTDNGWKCKTCDFTSDTRNGVVHHVNSKHLLICSMLCDICGKSFVRESSLRNHIMTHRETRSHLCQICSKGFKMKSSLRAHIKTHNRERRYVCDECGKSFKKNCTLVEHKKYHAGDFSFPCSWCNKRFVSKSALNTHMKNHSA